MSETRTRLPVCLPESVGASADTLIIPYAHHVNHANHLSHTLTNDRTRTDTHTHALESQAVARLLFQLRGEWQPAFASSDARFLVCLLLFLRATSNYFPLLIKKCLITSVSPWVCSLLTSYNAGSEFSYFTTRSLNKIDERKQEYL